MRIAGEVWCETGEAAHECVAMAGSVRIGEMDMSETIYTCDEIKQRLQPIFAGHRIRQAVLFGSYSKGTATSQSDVDLLVDSNLRGLQFMGLVEELREALSGKDMDVFDITHIEPKSRIAEEIKRTGVEIYAR